MSAEPGRRAPYSRDLRWRVVWQRMGMEYPFREIATNLTLSVGTAHNIYRKFEATGDVNPIVPDREVTRALTGEQQLLIVAMLFDHPCLYLSEVCQQVLQVFGVQVSPSTICRILHKHGLTRKKVQQVALQRCMDYRPEFMAEVLTFTSDKFVWVDETGCDRRDQIRRFGYALKGERPVYNRLLHRGQRISAIAAVASTGVVSVTLTKETVDGEKFVDFVRGTLIPEMLPFDGVNPQSIVVLDNCSVHHVAEVEQLFQAAGILVFFLPPYSPDLNPAEELFSYVKYYLKDHDQVLQATSNPSPLIHSAFDSVTPDPCLGWIRHSGY